MRLVLELSENEREYLRYAVSCAYYYATTDEAENFYDRMAMLLEPRQVEEKEHTEPCKDCHQWRVIAARSKEGTRFSCQNCCFVWWQDV